MGARGAPAVAHARSAQLTDTSSSRKYVGSDAQPSSWSLNQRTTVWPAYGAALNVTCVHAPEFEHAFSTVASVDPPVLRICIWIWSYVSVSGQCGWYQNVSRELPLGIVTVCVSVLSPL